MMWHDLAMFGHLDESAYASSVKSKWKLDVVTAHAILGNLLEGCGAPFAMKVTFLSSFAGAKKCGIPVPLCLAAKP